MTYLSFGCYCGSRPGLGASSPSHLDSSRLVTRPDGSFEGARRGLAGDVVCGFARDSSMGKACVCMRWRDMRAGVFKGPPGKLIFRAELRRGGGTE